MIQVLREEGTEYLFPGFIDKELQKYTSLNTTLAFEPRRGTDFYFSQDYIFSPREMPCKYAFYTLPSLKDYMQNVMGKNCSLVTYAADPTFHKPIKTEKVYDVGFIGRPYYPAREEYLRAITSIYKGKFLNAFDIPGFQVPEKLSQCKVLFNHTRDEIDINLRFFESMALGCQVMLRNKYISQFATEGEHYMGYSTPEEANEVIKRLLEDDNLREKITFNARSHFLTHHTYAHRAQSILNHMNEHFERNPV